MSEPVLEMKSLSFSVRGKPILRGITARFGAGERWAIIGANGAGKSTLLKCIMRIHTGWSGQVNLFGRPLSTYTQRELARHIAYVPQPGGDQRFPYTVREFVRMGRHPYSGFFGASRGDDPMLVEDAMHRAGVEHFAERTLDTLSGGERQKVFIAAALAQDTAILLLDEPTAFLDYRHQIEVADILRTLNVERNTTVISVVHDVNAALLSDGFTLALREGQSLWSGSTGELLVEDRLRAIFDVGFRLIVDPETGTRLVAAQGRGR